MAQSRPNFLDNIGPKFPELTELATSRPELTRSKHPPGANFVHQHPILHL